MAKRKGRSAKPSKANGRRVERTHVDDTAEPHARFLIFPIGRSLRGDVQHVTHAAIEEARKTRDPLVVGCARTLDALEFALRRRDVGAGQAMRKLEAVAMAYLETRTEHERWHNVALPARAVIDRAERLIELRDFAKTVALARFTGRTRRAEDIALMMVCEVWRRNLVNTSKRARTDDVRMLAGVVRKRLDRGLTAEALVVCSLKACGVSHVAANNWCKPLWPPAKRKPRPADPVV